MKNTAILFLLLIIGLGLSAQDRIYLKTRKIIKCKIVELGQDEIKYKKPQLKSDLVFSINIEKVSKVVLEDGEVVKYDGKEIYNPDNYVEDNPNALKINFLSPLTGSLRFSFEHSIKPGMSYEAAFGIIGIGTDLNETNPFGFTFGFGFKFIKAPDFNSSRTRFSHLLTGSYISPNIVFSAFNFDETNYAYTPNPGDVTIRKNVTNGAIMISVGKQWVFNNVFLMDWNFGIGYGFSSSYDEFTFGPGYTVGTRSFPIAFSSNIRIGFLFPGKKGKLKKVE